jgi:hypothetical protein
MKKLITLFAIAGMVLALAPATQAALVSDPGGITAPAGLIVGDQYQLVFVSSTVRDASSSDIADYHAHVQSAADAASIGTGVGVTWKAMASTPSVHFGNVWAVTEPVYLVNGTKVADVFWSKTHDVPININENGVAHTGVPGTKLFLADTDPTMAVWTATNQEGWRVGWPLGGTGGQTIDGTLVTPASSYGWSDVFSHFSWARDEGTGVPGHPDSFGAADQSLELPFYGLSEVLTVVSGGPVSTPGTLIFVK